MTVDATAAQYREFHRLNPRLSRGLSIMPHVDDIAALVRDTGAKTLLDYGCGKGAQYSEAKVHERWGGIMPTRYDPGIGEFSEYPSGEFDGVICTDVLEHVEDPDHVLGELFRLACKFVFLSISCVPSKKGKVLPDGRPLHIQVHPPEWWRPKIEHAREARDRTLQVRVAYITEP